MAAAGGSLGNFWVEISAKGVEATKAAVAGLEKKAVDVAGSIGVAFHNAFKFASVAITGLATAGLAGTQEGARMALAWQRLSREIAAVALPVFEAITKTVERLTGWMKSLTSVQQDSILAWGGLSAAAGLVASGIGTIPGLILGAVSAWKILKDSIGDDVFKGLGETFKGLFSSLGNLFQALKPMIKEALEIAVYGLSAIVKGVSFAIEAIAKAVTFLKESWDFVRKMNPLGYTQGVEVTDKKLPGFDKKRSVHQVAGGFESLTSTYGRLQASVNQAGSLSPEKQTADNTKRAADAAERSNKLAEEQLMLARNSVPLVGA